MCRRLADAQQNGYSNESTTEPARYVCPIDTEEPQARSRTPTHRTRTHAHDITTPHVDDLFVEIHTLAKNIETMELYRYISCACMCLWWCVYIYIYVTESLTRIVHVHVVL